MAGLVLGAEITGTVRDDRGEGVEGAYVIPYDVRLSFETYAVTDSSGEFQLTELPPGRVRLRVVPPMVADVEEQFVPGTLDVCEGDVLMLESETRVSLEVDLLPAARVDGRVVSPDGEPIADALVIARTKSGAPQLQTRFVSTDGAGEFSIGGLVIDDEPLYTLELDAEGYPRQYLGQVYDAFSAETMELDGGETLTVGDQVLLPGVAVEGTVFGPEGPLDSGAVHVYSSPVVVDASIEADGTYRAVGLPPGEALAWVFARGHGLTYWPSEDRPNERIETVEEGETVAGVDLTVPWQSEIRGRLVGDVDLSDVTVIAYNDERSVGVGSAVDADGTFAVERLHGGGSYELLIYASDEGYLDAFLADEAGDVLAIDVPMEGVVELGEIPLQLGNAVSGIVSDAVSGEPVYGAVVFARDGEGQSRTAITDESGAYELDGLADGAYRLWVDYTPLCPTDLDWVTIYHRDTPYEGYVETLRLTGGESATWDPEMPADLDHDGMDDAWESEFGLDPTTDDAALDPDEDGFSNLREYWLGTDPLVGPAGGRCGCLGSPPATPAALLLLVAGMRRRRD